MSDQDDEKEKDAAAALSSVEEPGEEVSEAVMARLDASGLNPEEFEEEKGMLGPQLVVDLEGFEGPLDVLLVLAREQKVDLVHISILALADQYLRFIEEARQLRLELAADYLVMAAWLAYLKSRLLLPQPAEDEEPSGAELAAALAFQLRRYESMKKAAAQLMARPQFKRDFFPNGAPEGIHNINRPVYEVSLYELLKSYGVGRNRAESIGRNLEILPPKLYSVDLALQRLNRLLGTSVDWQTIFDFLPENLKDSLMFRSALASTLVASLEMARQGRLKIRQESTFGPIYIRSSNEDHENHG